MKKPLSSVLLMTCVLFTPLQVRANEAVSTSDRIVLQAAMQEAIMERTIDGTFRYFDAADGELKQLFPVKAHPMILTFGENFVLCADFRDASGKDVNIDFYVVRKDDGYAVVDIVVNNRAPVEKLMKAGKIKVAS